MRSASQLAAEVAARHFGAISRRQLLALGVSPSRIARWIRDGRLHPRYPGVYAFGRAGLGTEGELAAALLFAGPESAMGGVSALWWLELLSRQPSPIRIDAPQRRRPQPGIRLRFVSCVQRADHRGLPLVPLPRALLAATADLSHDSLRLVLARAEFHRLLDLTAVHRALERGPRGSRALRAALAAHLPQLARCANALERDFVLLCERFDLPIPEPNVRIGRYVPDMLWEDLRLIVELDGKDAHSSAAQIQADAARQAVLESQGFTVIRFGWDDVHREPERTVATLRPLLSSPAAPSATSSGRSASRSRQSSRSRRARRT